MRVVVENLTKLYGEQKAVDNISFELNKGEITGFIGPNGSGKSTTMKAICGILTPNSGKVFVDGKDVNEHALEVKKNIGYLPESNPLYYDQFVAEYLLFTAKMYGIKNARKKVEEVIELTGLTPERKKQIGQLSKGYKQRVGIAQSLIHDPDVLVLDEPTTGLDPNQLAEIRQLILSIGKNKTVLLSTHILQEVEAICDRVIMINNGVIVTDNSTEAVRNGSEDTLTIKIEFKEEPHLETLKKIQGVTKIEELSKQVYLIESLSGIEIREELFKYAMNSNNSILEMQTVKRSLEDSFKKLSGK